MPIKLFEYWRDGVVNPIEVLKNQARFKSGLNEIKKEVINQKIK